MRAEIRTEGLRLLPVVGVSLGACAVEKHVKIAGVESADSEFSMEMDVFASMVKDVRNAKLIAQGPDYTLSPKEKGSTVFRRSLFAVEDIKNGEMITSENVRSIRPGYGVPPKFLKDIVGKPCPAEIKRGEPITEEILRRILS